MKGFYVDDGLVSLPTVEQTVDLMRRTQEALNVHGNLPLHKIASNEKQVMEAFPSADLAKDLKISVLSMVTCRCSKVWAYIEIYSLTSILFKYLPQKTPVPGEVNSTGQSCYVKLAYLQYMAYVEVIIHSVTGHLGP